MATQFSRQTAVPCTLAELSAGAWVQNDGLVPSGVRTGRGLVSRASVLGVIIDKHETSFSLDDGTRVVSVRSFDATPVPVRAEVGDIVLVVGRPREYNGERYLILEICKRIRNPAWVLYRRKELEWFSSRAPALDAAPEPRVTMQDLQAEPVAPLPSDAEPQKNPFERILDRIRELDAGSGVDIEEVLAVVPEADRLVQTLIEEGEIFEIRPGRLKVLE